MELIYIALAVIIILGILYILPKRNTESENSGRKRRYKQPIDYSYMPYRKAYILTKTEHTFFIILVREALKHKLLVCPKVRLEDVAFVTDKKNRNRYRGYIKSRHVDFVLMDAQCNTVAAIELDDPSHNTKKAADTDRFKDELFKAINVPLFRIKTGTNFTEEIATALDSIK